MVDKKYFYGYVTTVTKYSLDDYFLNNSSLQVLILVALKKRNNSLYNLI